MSVAPAFSTSSTSHRSTAVSARARLCGRLAAHRRPRVGALHVLRGVEAGTALDVARVRGQRRDTGDVRIARLTARVERVPLSLLGIRAEKGGADTGPSPVDRLETGSKHHLICNRRGTPLKAITTAANVNDIAQTLALVDGSPPVAGRPGSPRRRPDAVLGNKAYNSRAVHRELRKRRIMPVISRKGSPNIKGLGKLRYVMEKTFALLHQFSPSDGKTDRTPQHLRLVLSDLLEAPQDDPIMIVLRALRLRWWSCGMAYQQEAGSGAVTPLGEAMICPLQVATMPPT
ncbi:transposase [Streptomyces lydicus]|uniref:transposase n=1 Tax=Streptomyces lydicus TaxID=47763 RepID=UPI0036CED1B8